MRRRLAAVAAGLLVCAGPAAQPAIDYPAVTPGSTLAFPRDHGAHPDYRIEWWYFTGWLKTSEGEPLGFQITFFRSRPKSDPANPSAFAPHQILFAHAALSDRDTGELIHDQRMAREGFGIAAAAARDAEVKLIDWTLVRRMDGTFHAGIPANRFTLDLRFEPTQPVMLNGDAGYSRKGVREGQASYYYSMPHLKVHGAVMRQGKRVAVTGTAWLDREWSSSLLPSKAVGWDWAGINFDDGSALMAFQVRGRKGEEVYAGGTYRRPDGSTVALDPDEVEFVPRRIWRSPTSGARYPVEASFVIDLPEGIRRVPLRPLFDAQELRTGRGVMPTYWEGAVATPGGRGYLELTGYAKDLNL